jgi:hypothetical protein
VNGSHRSSGAKRRSRRLTIKSNARPPTNQGISGFGIGRDRSSRDIVIKAEITRHAGPRASAGKPGTIQRTHPAVRNSDDHPNCFVEIAFITLAS